MSKLHVAAAAALSPFVVWPVLGLGSAPSPRKAQEERGAPASFWWADYDADGRVDAYVVQAGAPGRLLRNAGDGGFEDVTERAGLAGYTGAHMAVWADFDSDGRLDLYLPSATGESVLLGQSEGGAFEDRSELSGLPADARPLRAAALDFDADGRPDLHLSGPAGEALYHNRGVHGFARVPLELGGAAGAVGLAHVLSERAAGEPMTAPAAASVGALHAPSTLPPAPTGVAGGGALPGSFAGTCAPDVEDQAGGSCIQASRVPTLDKLYPITEDLFVDASFGRVGIGTTAPTRRLHVDGRIYAEVGGFTSPAIHGVSDDGTALQAESSSNTEPTAHFQQHGGSAILECENAAGLATLRVRTQGGLLAQSSYGAGDASSSSAVAAENSATGNGHALYATTHGTGATVRIEQQGSGDYIRAHNASGTSVFRVTNTGRVRTTALQITGGGDLVEGFDAGEAELEAGTVVVIDPDAPGRVRESAGAYDPKVVGAISGAGGVDHGIRMGQDGVLDGEALVAMTGRIYVRCSAENGPIAPGDLLTSAELAGHAMKATDPQRAFGAVIGKALTSLDEGTGLVLVVVALQ